MLTILVHAKLKRFILIPRADFSRIAHHFTCWHHMKRMCCSWSPFWSVYMQSRMMSERIMYVNLNKNTARILLLLSYQKVNPYQLTSFPL